MDISYASDANGITIGIGGDINIYTVSQIEADIRPRLEKELRVAIDLSRVVSADTAGVQLLLWLKRHIRERGGECVLRNHPLHVIKIMDVLGIIGIMGDPVRLKKTDRAGLILKYGLKRPQEG